MASSLGRKSAPPTSLPVPVGTAGLSLSVMQYGHVRALARFLRAPPSPDTSQPHLCSVYHPLCSRTCRCTCRTVGCSGRSHQCGSCQSPPHTHPHLAGAERVHETLCWRVPNSVLKVVPQQQNPLSSKAEPVTPPEAGAQLRNFRNSERTPTSLKDTNPQ